MPPMASTSGGAKPVVIKNFGVNECIGHSTSAELAANTFIQACPSMSDTPIRIVEKTVRVDGAEREVYAVERVG